MDSRDVWGRAPDEGAAYLKEIALFLAVHIRQGGAGVLWLESRHPMLRRTPRPRDLAFLSAQLSWHTGLRARSSLGAEGAESGLEHTLVQQVAGGSAWLLTPQGENPRSASLRLHSGDVLYVPPLYGRLSVATAADSAWIVTALR